MMASLTTLPTWSVDRGAAATRLASAATALGVMPKSIAGEYGIGSESSTTHMAASATSAAAMAAASVEAKSHALSLGPNGGYTSHL